MTAPHRNSRSAASVEGAVLSAVAEVMGSGPHQPSDNFYDFGGTSLDAIRICLRVGREVGVDIAPETLLDSEDFAEFVAAVTGAVAEAVPVPGNGPSTDVTDGGRPEDVR
ncbi:acyl carrier protein [Streptomyces sp. NPDC050856]|uniref:acyl carrier protein n=1 Tax=Streptomyces sp. NPDC050856 TaxID=3154939 RepID=UPI0033C9FCFC